MSNEKLDTHAQQNQAASGWIDVDIAIDPIIERSLRALEGRAPELAGMARYHLGSVDQSFAPIASGSIDRGKRFRPAVALLTCSAAGADPATAAPLAAAIELLHNFTLVHDDIQDRSPTRRHRSTVWNLWGEPQAINVGDALFAAAHVALLQLRENEVPANTVLDLVAEFERVTLDIVGGQVLDLSFETRTDVSSADYLQMISGKTAAIVEFAAAAGAMVAGADTENVARYAEFGLALGLGFQTQDDLLGVWGESRTTGKAAADDIRRRKQSLPIVILRERLVPSERDRMVELYNVAEVDPAGISEVLDMLSRYEVRPAVEAVVRTHHDAAIDALLKATPHESTARSLLLQRVESLAKRAT